MLFSREMCYYWPFVASHSCTLGNSIEQSSSPKSPDFSSRTGANQQYFPGDVSDSFVRLICGTRRVNEKTDARYTTITTPSPVANTRALSRDIGYEYFLNWLPYSSLSNRYLHSATK